MASGDRSPKSTSRTPSLPLPDNTGPDETGLDQETPLASKISAIQLSGKSRSFTNVFQRRRKDTSIHSSGSFLSHSNRSQDSASDDVSVTVAVSMQEVARSAIVPVSPFKQVKYDLGSRACVQRTSQHTKHVFVECIKGVGGLQDEFRVSSLCFASHELRPGIRLLVSFETIFVGRRAWHRI